MKIYLLKRLDAVSWDENEGFVIRAKDEKEARKLAKDSADGSYGEYPGIWEDKELSSCDIVSTSGDSQIILTDFNAG